MSDVICSVCGYRCVFGDIVWMDNAGVMYCPDCHIGSVAKEYVVIEWPTEDGNCVLHTAAAMSLDKWR